MKDYKEYPHNPPHLFVKDCKYFITASTYKKQRLISSDTLKESLIQSIFTEFSRYNWLIEDWVILDNHYHLMTHSSGQAAKLGNIMREIHKFSALEIKKFVPVAKDIEKVWYNYWDTCITFESSYYTRISYIWFNPVKHGYVNDPKDWKYGSYYYRIKENTDKLKEIVKKCPFDKVKVFDIDLE